MPDRRSTIRVLTWNVHGCVGGDGRHDVERVRSALRDLAPDVAAFQEIDSRRRFPGVGRVYDILREEVGDHDHGAWAISTADGHYGQFLASRFPLEDKQVHDISVTGQEPRKVMTARLRLSAASPLRVIATHLGLRRGERRRQLAALQKIIRAEPPGPILLLGDFNEWLWPHWTQGDLFRLFDAYTSHRSFPARLPLLPLDRILCRPAGLLGRSWAAGEARAASDHLPVLAEVTLPAPP